MKPTITSLRPFLGAQNFEQSQAFYKELGFEETVIDQTMSVFKIDAFAFYLQRAYVKDWVDNTMLFLEVSDPESVLQEVLKKDLPSRYPKVRVSKMVYTDWGMEFFVHDPSGILWHIGSFK